MPNGLNVAILVAGLLFGWLNQVVLTDLLLGVATAFGVILPFFALRVYRGGDAKLLIACGAWLQPLEWLTGFALGMTLGAIWAIIVVVLDRDERREAILTLRVLYWSRLGTVGEETAGGRKTVPMAVAFGVAMSMVRLVNVETYLA